MAGPLLNVSNTHLFWKDREPMPIEEHHRPSFLAFPQDPTENIAAARERLLGLVQGVGDASPDKDDLAKVHSIGETLRYQSFWDHDRARDVIPVTGKRSYWVPDISDRLFFDHGFYTCEHDVPYQERALADLSAQKDWWMWETKDGPSRLDVLTYDIETTKYGTGAKDIPIDIIGYAEFPVAYEAHKDLETEEFDFRFHDVPSDWQEREVMQLVSRDRDEELDHLMQFTQHAVEYDIIAGHNILGFDNLKIRDRIQEALQQDQRRQDLSPGMRSWFEEFTRVWSRKDRSFHFGTQSDIAVFHPVSLDTFHAARKFYFFHDDFTLKGLAPWLGIHVPERVHLDTAEMTLDDPKTLEYNKHDIHEQVGITQILVAQALPMAFTVDLPLESLLTGGNTKMWDHMAFTRARRQRKIMPATSRAQGMARSIHRLVRKPFPTREEVAQAALDLPEDERSSGGNKEFVRVAKQGPEMPFWCEHPGIVLRTDGREGQGYEIAGGLTLKPDSDLQSHFVPWFHVVEADVGAMYPTILKAKNLTADTVQPARDGEEVDDWIWLRDVDAKFSQSGKYQVRRPEENESYTRGKGWMVGVKHSGEPGMVNLAMTGILDTIQKVKDARAEAKRDGADPDQIRVLDMTYASLKAARNAGTHGILVAVNVSCRQFNVWGGANITTIGQEILHETKADFEKEGIRVVYGDSIAGERCVIVRDPKQRIRVMPVEELFQAASDPHDWHGKEGASLPGWCAWSQAGDQAGWHPITRVIRHAYGKPLVRARQVDGETVCTTDHSLMLQDGDHIRRARPDEVPTLPMVRVPPPPAVPEARIDLLEWILPVAEQIEASAPQNRLFRPPRPTLTFHWDDEWMWWNLHTRPDIGPLRCRRHVPLGTPASLSFFRMLGAYAAEGSVTFNGSRRGASLAGPSEWVASFAETAAWLLPDSRCKVIRSSHGTRTIAAGAAQYVYEDETHKLQMTNVIAATVFWALGGKGSAHKRVPDFVFNAPRQEQQAFLDAAVEGDGSRNTDSRYRAEHRERHWRYTTKSTHLASGISVLMHQLGLDHGIRRDPRKNVYNLWTRDSKKPFQGGRVEPAPAAQHVYDLEVADAHTFVDAMGSILLHNTDGIYLGCSKSAGNIPHFAAALDADVEPEADKWITLPDKAVGAIDAANKHWREWLEYPAFELEAEQYDAMVFIVHKNYLKFKAAKDGTFQMETKGNNFRGSDKAPLAQTLLLPIMQRALRDVASWDDEEDARERMRAAIKRATQAVMQETDINKTPWAELILRQQVQPLRSYKPNPDGSLSTFAVRTAALEQVIQEPLTASRKFKFVVCKEPLPLYNDVQAQQEAKERLARQGYNLQIKKPRKSGIKPIEYMWPAEQVKTHMVDWIWYKDMVENYVKGAFGFDSLELATQRDLSSWF